MKDEKYEELLKEFQENAPQEAQPTSEEVPEEVGEPGAEIPGEGYDGGDSSILATVTGDGDGLTVGDGEQALGATVTTPTTEPTYDGSDSSILSGLNLGGGEGISIGTPDMSSTVSVEPPVSPQPGPQPIQSVEVPGVNNIQVNEPAFTDERVLPGLDLNIDMNTITGGPRNVDIPIGGAVNGINSFSAPPTDSDTAILNGLNVTEGGMSVGGTSNAPIPQIDTPSINTMISPELDKEISKELTSDDISTAVRNSSNSQSNDTSRFIEPPSSKEEVHGIVEQSNKEKKLEGGIVIELGEDGSLRL